MAYYQHVYGNHPPYPPRYQQARGRYYPQPQQQPYLHPHPYSPATPTSYSYPSPTAPVFTPSWQSPLPKQLSMPPPPPMVHQTYYEQPPPPSHLQEPRPEPELEPTLDPVSQSSSYAQMGTIVTPESQPQSSPTTRRNPTANWAVWSRRPHDPAHAPGIIISPKARPPPDVVQQALDIKTPPPTRPASPELTLAVSAESAGDEKDTEHEHEQNNSTVTSSSVTETTDTPTLPCSPASSHTSLSVAGTPVKDQLVEVESTAESEVPSVASSASLPEPPAPATPSSSIPPSAETSAAPAAPSPPPAGPKKLWSALLRPSPSASASATSSSTTRNALPTSSIIGFSIPASSDLESSSTSSTSNNGPTSGLSTSKRNELVNLLTTAPTAPTPQVVSYAAVTHAATTTQSGDPTQKIRLRGLINNGNMCFANSVLQVLVYCPPFHRFFVELGKILGSASGGKSGSGLGLGLGDVSLVEATIQFLHEFGRKERKEKEQKERGKGKERATFMLDERGDSEWEGDSFLPTYVYDAMKAKKRFDTMRGGHQEDAEEFFGFYLDTLEEELLSILHTVNPPPNKEGGTVEEKEEAAPAEGDGWLEVGKKNRMVVTRTIKAIESPITRMFGGKFRSTLRAPGQKDSIIVEDWRSLRLDIQRDQIHTIQDALSFISHPSPVQVTQATKPGVTIEAQQQVLIEALPPVLVLHVKRFCYDTDVGGVVKVGKQVSFGPELEIGADIMVPSTHPSKRTQAAKYKLFSVVYHHGHTASGGHYTLDVLHPNRYPGGKMTKEGWVRMDDELVSDVRHEDVFDPKEREDGRCAYLLFYRRV